MRRFLLATGLFVLLLSAVPASAQTSAADDARLRTLTSLYEQLERAPENAYLLQRITDERQAVREAFTETLNAAVAPPAEETPGENLTQAIERQRRAVDVLEDQLQEHRVDRDLLNAEEREYYREGQTSTGVIAFRLTATHAELQARRAILEEQINVLNERLALAKERARQLTVQATFQQFEATGPLIRYLVILLAIWFAERLIRTRLLMQIPDLSRRYRTIKVFSTTVYIVTAVWLVGTVLSRRPDAVTSFAIIGAGVAIALQDLFKDLFGFIMIRRSRLFQHGHRITIGSFWNVTGEVADIGMFRTKLLEVSEKGDILERTGKMVSIPNALVLNQIVWDHHATSDYARAELHLTLPFDTDWREAEKILTEIILEETGDFSEREHRQHDIRTRAFYIPQQSRGPVVHINIAEEGIQFTLRFSTPIGERRPVVTRLTKRILEAFEGRADIKLGKSEKS